MVSPKSIKSRPRCKKKEVYFTEDELAQVVEAASIVDLPISVYLRKLALAQKIRPARPRQVQEFIVELGALGAELNRVGNNLNQLAHQANAGRFPAEGILDHSSHKLDQVLADISELIKRV